MSKEVEKYLKQIANNTGEIAKQLKEHNRREQRNNVHPVPDDDNSAHSARGMHEDRELTEQERRAADANNAIESLQKLGSTLGELHSVNNQLKDARRKQEYRNHARQR